MNQKIELAAVIALHVSDDEVAVAVKPRCRYESFSGSRNFGTPSIFNGLIGCFGFPLTYFSSMIVNLLETLYYLGFIGSAITLSAIIVKFFHSQGGLRIDEQRHTDTVNILYSFKHVDFLFRDTYPQFLPLINRKKKDGLGLRITMLRKAITFSVISLTDSFSQVIQASGMPVDSRRQIAWKMPANSRITESERCDSA